MGDIKINSNTLNNFCIYYLSLPSINLHISFKYCRTQLSGTPIKSRSIALSRTQSFFYHAHISQRSNNRALELFRWVKLLTLTYKCKLSEESYMMCEAIKHTYYIFCITWLGMGYKIFTTNSKICSNKI